MPIHIVVPSARCPCAIRSHESNDGNLLSEHGMQNTTCCYHAGTMCNFFPMQCCTTLSNESSIHQRRFCCSMKPSREKDDEKKIATCWHDDLGRPLLGKRPLRTESTSDLLGAPREFRSSERSDILSGAVGLSAPGRGNLSVMAGCCQREGSLCPSHLSASPPSCSCLLHACRNLAPFCSCTLASSASWTRLSEAHRSLRVRLAVRTVQEPSKHVVGYVPS